MSGLKSLVFYTAVDDNNKRLNFATDILLTLEPADSDSLPRSSNPIAWKVLRFDPSFPAQQTVIWHKDAGFSLVVENEDGTYSMRTQKITVEPKHMTSLDETGSAPCWSTPVKNHDNPTIVAFNNCPIPKTFALCSVDNTGNNSVFSPVVFLGTFGYEQKIECQTPVILQAYAIAGYKEGQLFKASDKEHFLLKNHKNEPKPLNMEDARKVTVFRLYSHSTGRPTLELVSG
ncbi:hypothetical protein MVEN_01282800 [Mycena venus]|uniref:Uncharacterized protein n=1 Tax=Mycena venus TaxID=2733690 RepID=A0A8H7CTI2_9AGAR|nr:hypothetical protein MVEN_01282800 [Mycena venus]